MGAGEAVTGTGGETGEGDDGEGDMAAANITTTLGVDWEWA